MNVPNTDLASAPISDRACRFRIRDDGAAVRIGIMLAGFSALLIVVHIVAYIVIVLRGHRDDGVLGNIYYFVDLGRDHSISENLNHGMLFTCAMVFLYVFYKVRSRTLLFMSSFFGFAWLDDSCQYHERFGIIFAQVFEFPEILGLRAKDLGELLAWILAALALISIGIWAYRGKQNGDGIIVKSVSIPMGALVFCGVVFDMAHIAVGGPVADVVFTALEDGGEMMSIAAATTVSLAIFGSYRMIYRRDQVAS